MSQSLPTTDTALYITKIDEAKALLQTDWDSDGSISVHLPQAQAERLLQRLGWEHHPTQVLSWVMPTTEVLMSPNGRTPELQEALTLALVALGI